MIKNGYLVTSVRRGAPLVGSGFVYWISEDLSSNCKLIEAPAPLYPNIDINKAFGGKRGFRGIRRWRSHIVIAAFDRLLIYDMYCNLVEEYTHQLFTDIHGIEVSEDGIWVTSTGNDALLLLGWDGELKKNIFLSEIRTLISNIRLIPKYCDYRRKVLTNMRLHPNYISILDKEIYICCRKTGKIAIVDIKSGNVQWDARIDALELPHDARYRVDGKYQVCEFTETGTGNLTKITLFGNNVKSVERVSLSEFGDMTKSRPPSRNRTNWLRGLLYIGNNSYLAGQAPARILHIENKMVKNIIILDDFPDSAVFDIISTRS